MTELEPNKKEQRELELDDLLISSSDDANELKSNGSKKIVLLSAIGVLLFAIVILVVYMLQGDSKKQESQIEAQRPLERIEQRTPNTQTSNIQTNDFGQEPIRENANADDQFQRIIEQIKAEQAKQGVQNLPKAPESKQVAETKAAQPADPLAPAKSQTKPQATKESPKQNPADSFKNVKTSDPSMQGSEATKGFYVQVGSFSKFSPNKQLLGVIESNKLSYRMQKSGDNNRLLIGPFTSKQEAQSKLNEIREKINKDAFIKEIR
ncbi:SPOR domain-containing protein [Helicobacter turcicus]|uniref:SPOR domain-containing protein n=1 Tax=Helicobacter turcicus TaxID=2867412 RepID=A0ABS7JLP9_9HELI|nr:SPOR domain-containing protein [Helicobacter turcicus]MBX7490313.1 SPOR domain-containing protein [Helicobacter turcicus]MBX7545108.1 SPOR domain-containing protein [Helicobacter turcicus]